MTVTEGAIKRTAFLLSDLLMVAGLVVFNVATVFGVYVWVGQWPALAILGVWLMFWAWFIVALYERRER